jgi:hypothetical protein
MQCTKMIEFVSFKLGSKMKLAYFKLKLHNFSTRKKEKVIRGLDNLIPLMSPVSSRTCNQSIQDSVLSLDCETELIEI